MNRNRRVTALLLALLPAPALAGPPYVTDDPEPTDYRHYEIYLFAQGEGGRGGHSGAYGIDFNYGAGENLQLTATLPVAHGQVAGEEPAHGIGNIELAAKYRFGHKEDFGWDVAVFPRVFLPSSSDRVGEKHASLLLPIWLQRDWGQWSTFGGGGCVLNRGGDSKDFCLAGWVLTRQLSPHLQLGAEIAYQSADTRGGRAATRTGAGLKYDFNDTWHWLAYAGPGLQNIAASGRYAWYTSVLLTF